MKRRFGVVVLVAGGLAFGLWFHGLPPERDPVDDDPVAEIMEIRRSAAIPEPDLNGILVRDYDSHAEEDEVADVQPRATGEIRAHDSTTLDVRSPAIRESEQQVEDAAREEHDFPADHWVSPSAVREDASRVIAPQPQHRMHREASPGYYPSTPHPQQMTEESEEMMRRRAMRLQEVYAHRTFGAEVIAESEIDDDNGDAVLEAMEQPRESVNQDNVEDVFLDWLAQTHQGDDDTPEHVDRLLLVLNSPQSTENMRLQALFLLADTNLEYVKHYLRDEDEVLRFEAQRLTGIYLDE